MPVVQLARLIRAKKISSREVVLSYLKQIEQVNRELNAIVVLRAEQALEQADMLDDLTVRGKIKGPLHGVPFTLKDIFNTTGDVVTAGCLGLKDNVAEQDASIVTRLYDAGAILLGKTNTAELDGAADTDNLIYGRTANPYDINYSAGGSSGGSASIVAACGSAFDIGNDSGGSLRIPASYCGVTTIRPTVGRVPTSGMVYGQPTSVAGLIASEGPIARFVSDLEVILKIISGPDGQDPQTIPIPYKGIDSNDTSKFKVAFFTSADGVQTTPEVKKAVVNAAHALAAKGAEIHEINPNFINEGFNIFYDIIGANAVPHFISILKSLNTPKVSPLMKKLFDRLQPKMCNLKEFMERWQLWDNYRSRTLNFMQNYDVLICPVSAKAPLHKSQHMWDEENLPASSYCWAISMANMPAVVLRTGTSAEGLPIGVQIAAKPWQEDVALTAARLIEMNVGGYKMPTAMKLELTA